VPRRAVAVLLRSNLRLQGWGASWCRPGGAGAGPRARSCRPRQLRGRPSPAGGRARCTHLLQLCVRAHAGGGVLLGQGEHAEVEGVEAGERDKLELVAQRAQVRLEAGDLLVVQQLLPVEGGRAVVGQQLACARAGWGGGGRG
jgi:hypothetical protein